MGGFVIRISFYHCYQFRFRIQGKRGQMNRFAVRIGFTSADFHRYAVLVAQNARQQRQAIHDILLFQHDATTILRWGDWRGVRERLPASLHAQEYPA